MIRHIFMTACVVQSLLLLGLGGFTLWYSSELMLWLIHLVGEERALGATNVVRLENGGILLTNPAGMLRWSLPIWLAGLTQIASAVVIVILLVRVRRVERRGFTRADGPADDA